MESKTKKSVVIIGGGPAGMMLACHLDSQIYDVTIVEKEKSIGRKFLVAGKGGFNLTHSEPISSMINKYDGTSTLIDALQSFTNTDLRHWLSSLGIETYVGSSKRVFPIKGVKPIEVLKAIQAEMKRRSVTVLTDHRWSGEMMKDDTITIIHNAKRRMIKAEVIVFAMGGGSWKVTGSDGAWLPLFTHHGIATAPFRASNCMLQINWSDTVKVHIGKPIKNIALSYGDKYIKGEILLTNRGIEGSPAYALSYEVGAVLETHGPQTIYLDLKPTIGSDKILNLLSTDRKKTTAILKNDLALSTAAIALIKSVTSREEFNDTDILSKKIKRLPLSVVGIGTLDEAISTVGGVDETALNDNLELTNFPRHFAIGEMINWNAPTGGYLLQGCFSLGWYLAQKLNNEVYHTL